MSMGMTSKLPTRTAFWSGEYRWMRLPLPLPSTLKSYVPNTGCVFFKWLSAAMVLANPTRCSFSKSSQGAGFSLSLHPSSNVPLRQSKMLIWYPSSPQFHIILGPGMASKNACIISKRSMAVASCLVS